jgi:NAD(P)H-hydrate repair Nnr-like enzyme with NAD(P)H-hydrate dehydratase domain
LGSEALQENLVSIARLNTLPQPKRQPHHASHKGTFGDVAVVGGESVQTRGMGMSGAVDLAALAALHAGAGRVMVSYLNQGADVATRSMEVMARSFDALDLKNSAVVCGCGGGIEIKKDASTMFK